jgi:TPP-dependent indolepyruvate ferredoxin oxidoreductase alpha subunit
MATQATTKAPADERVAPVREIMSGNEAIARAAWEAGVRFASAYPGTPSTEILEALARYDDVYCEWAPNEKVAMEAAIGASMAGARALVCMKHVGLNVAADPFFSASHVGVKGGLVIVSADDPGMHSSQDEQDNRQYARFAKMPMIEAAEAGEMGAYLSAAYELSESFDTPVLFRTTTRTSHSQGIVTLGERRPAAPPILTLDRDPARHIMMPHNARPRHAFIEQRLLDLAAHAESSPLNRVELGDVRVGIVSSGAAYGCAREAFPAASILKRDTGPRVYYRKLHRYACAFVGGTLTEVREGREECAAGVGVALLRAGTEVASTTSDVFGEFKFDGLGEGSGAYEVVARPGTAPAPSIPVVLGSSVYLGSIPLP